MKKKIKFNSDYYLSIIKPIREELKNQLHKKIGVSTRNRDGTYTVAFEDWEIDAIDRITEGLWKDKEIK